MRQTYEILSGILHDGVMLLVFVITLDLPEPEI